MLKKECPSSPDGFHHFQRVLLDNDIVLVSEDGEQVCTFCYVDSDGIEHPGLFNMKEQSARHTFNQQLSDVDMTTA